MAMLGSGEASARATQPFGREMLNSLTGSWTVIAFAVGLAEGDVAEAVGAGLPLVPLVPEVPVERLPTMPQPATPRIATITRATMRMPTRWATLIGPPGGLKKLPMNPRSAGGGGGGAETFAAGRGFGLGSSSGAGGASVCSGPGPPGAEVERSGTFSSDSEGFLPDFAA